MTAKRGFESALARAQQGEIGAPRRLEVPERVGGEVLGRPDVAALPRAYAAAERRRHTVYLPRDISRWVQIQAVEEEREISQVVEDALRAYRSSLAGS